MDSYVINYDLEDGDPSPYEPFIEEAEKQELHYVWHGEDLLLRSPNTTAWGRFDRIADARSAFDGALGRASRCVDYDINVEKWSTVNAGDFLVKSDVGKDLSPSERAPASSRLPPPSTQRSQLFILMRRRLTAVPRARQKRRAVLTSCDVASPRTLRLVAVGNLFGCAGTWGIIPPASPIPMTPTEIPASVDR